MKPAIALSLSRSLRTVPVPRKNIRTSDEDLAVVGELHLDAGNGPTDAAGFEVPRVIQRTNSGGFGQPVCLQNGDADHGEEKLGVASQRRRAADQRLQVLADHLAP